MRYSAPPWGLQMDPMSHGLKVSLVWREGIWQVAVPDMKYVAGCHWVPGNAVPIDYKPLPEFLKHIEEWCGICSVHPADEATQP